jgi:hypothetical protein
MSTRRASRFFSTKRFHCLSKEFGQARFTSVKKKKITISADIRHEH